MAYPFIIQGKNIVVVIGNKSHTISSTHITYTKVLDAIKAGDWETVKDVIEPKKVVLNYGQGNVSIQGETLFWKGAEMHTSLSKRMIQMLQDGFPIEPLVLFMENLMNNPSYRAVNELYGFLEKKVRNDYMDIHSGTFNNSVGYICEMERNQVDDNQNNTCSSGLHFCSKEYLNHFGSGDSRTMIVKINPADVVSIPTDYNNSKGRTCRYTVIGELGVEVEDAFTQPVQEMANQPAPAGTQPDYTAQWPSPQN